MAKPRRTQPRMVSEGRLEDGRPVGTSRTSSHDDGSSRLSLVSSSADETQQLGVALGRLLRPGDLILLQGPLGAGKTCFTQGIARGFGFEGRVVSPSFTLANVYEPSASGHPLYHLDLWRIKSPAEALGLGLDEYLAGGGPTVIEWPEVAETVLPYEYLQIRIDPVDEARRFEFYSVGTRPRMLLDELRRSLASLTERSGGARAAGD